MVSGWWKLLAVEFFSSCNLARLVAADRDEGLNIWTPNHTSSLSPVLLNRRGLPKFCKKTCLIFKPAWPKLCIQNLRKILPSIKGTRSFHPPKPLSSSSFQMEGCDVYPLICRCSMVGKKTVAPIVPPRRILPIKTGKSKPDWHGLNSPSLALSSRPSSQFLDDSTCSTTLGTFLHICCQLQKSNS